MNHPFYNAATNASSLARPTTSGCYTCPIHAPAKRIVASINPMPCFPNLNGGYFSVPLSSWYRPADARRQRDFLVTGDIAPADLGLFQAMICHEQGHVLLNDTWAKLYLRVMAAEGYEALWRLMTEDDDAAWEILAQCNQAVDEVIWFSQLVEEVFATHLGFLMLKEGVKAGLIPLSLEDVKKLRRRFDAKHKTRFSRPYKDMIAAVAKIQRRCGSKPLGLVASYAQGRTGVEAADRSIWTLGGFLAFLRECESTALSHARIELGLIEIQNIIALWDSHYRSTPTSNPLQSMTEEQWDELLGKRLPGYAEQAEDTDGIAADLKRDFITLKARWRTRQMQGISLNPVNGMYIAAQGEIIAAPPWAIKGAERKRLTARKSIPSPYVGPEGVIAQVDNDARWPMLALPKDGGRVGLCFLPRKQADGSVPFGFSLSFTPISPDIANDLDTLVFFEGLRTQVGWRRGLRCPLATDGICCGRSELLGRLYRAGERGCKAQHIDLLQWEKPPCL